MADLLTSGEVGQVLGVSRQRVHQLIEQYPDFPTPVDKIGGRDVWARADVIAWDAAHPNRKAGRPPGGDR